MDPGVIAGAGGFCAALACTAVCVTLLRRFRQGALEAVDQVREDCHKSGEELRNALSSIEANMQTTEELLREGRLNRSTRAQALKMLRSGVSPETAANSLGMATRELRLLARVSELLCR